MSSFTQTTHCGACEDGCWQFVTGRCSCHCCPSHWEGFDPPFDPPTSQAESDTVTIKRLSKELGEAKAAHAALLTTMLTAPNKLADILQSVIEASAQADPLYHMTKVLRSAPPSPCALCGRRVVEMSPTAGSCWKCELRALAKKATPGPYVWDWKCGTMSGAGLMMMKCRDIKRDEVTIKADDARFIAAVDPQTVLTLLDEVDRLRERLGPNE